MNTLYPKEWLDKSSIGERVAAELRMQIISDRIESGSVISENKIASQFGTSRSPVREALKVLSSDGLIQLERMGAVVIGFSENDIEEMYDIRKMIESFVLERVIESENDDLIKKLRQIIEMMRISVKYQDAEGLTIQDLDFHETIIRTIHHNQIMLLWSKLRPVMECFILLSMRRRFIDKPEDAERIVSNHISIIEAIQNKDRELLTKAIYQNFHTQHMLEKERETK
ncbi:MULTISPECIES: GntR family transcriptional regulator [Virgibacillus]|uniref:GntR family transcriptional regulator n=2 Tax=Virgibacillus TaxID=84406 RepID=A0ABQ2DNJ6_9BACI|nr:MULTISPECIES: GntR family transcriptional regulator [Virgibacillus]EQB36917.1 hypothetical protein M948_10850 [Virgibacillus sp. CM-4]MYL43096.1 FCD domain-containing protein [Virgibacillus massiliensis]GGJ65094.1 GntR family transcriptional regulator [Virgibacillus kapii]CDQ41994.1 putative HTH-type transcriptional regulator YdfH [Virgibacillus massiliensis]